MRGEAVGLGFNVLSACFIGDCCLGKLEDREWSEGVNRYTWYGACVAGRSGGGVAVIVPVETIDGLPGEG